MSVDGLPVCLRCLFFWSFEKIHCEGIKMTHPPSAPNESVGMFAVDTTKSHGRCGKCCSSLRCDIRSQIVGVDLVGCARCVHVLRSLPASVIGVCITDLNLGTPSTLVNSDYESDFMQINWRISFHLAPISVFTITVPIWFKVFLAPFEKFASVQRHNVLF